MPSKAGFLSLNKGTQSSLINDTSQMGALSRADYFDIAYKSGLL
jgi:hypothetical protein